MSAYVVNSSVTHFWSQNITVVWLLMLYSLVQPHSLLQIYPKGISSLMFSPNLILYCKRSAVTDPGQTPCLLCCFVHVLHLCILFFGCNSFVLDVVRFFISLCIWQYSLIQLMIIMSINVTCDFVGVCQLPESRLFIFLHDLWAFQFQFWSLTYLMF